MSPVRGIPTSRAYWELKAEQVLNRVFEPEKPIEVEVCDTPAAFSDAGSIPVELHDLPPAAVSSAASSDPVASKPGASKPPATRPAPAKQPTSKPKQASAKRRPASAAKPLQRLANQVGRQPSLLLMDAWHWTSLVVLLCYAGLRAIPQAYYQAARIDGAGPWAIFRHIQLPRLRLVLLIAILLRLMDSFMIYAEAYVVTRGGPGVSTTFLSHELIQTATIQFDLGEGGAMSILYLLIIAVISWAFFTLIVPQRDQAA